MLQPVLFSPEKIYELSGFYFAMYVINNCITFREFASLKDSLELNLH